MESKYNEIKDLLECKCNDIVQFNIDYELSKQEYKYLENELNSIKSKTNEYYIESENSKESLIKEVNNLKQYICKLESDNVNINKELLYYKEYSNNYKIENAKLNNEKDYLKKMLNKFIKEKKLISKQLVNNKKKIKLLKKKLLIFFNKNTANYNHNNKSMKISSKRLHYIINNNNNVKSKRYCNNNYRSQILKPIRFLSNNNSNLINIKSRNNPRKITFDNGNTNEDNDHIVYLSSIKNKQIFSSSNNKINNKNELEDKSSLYSLESKLSITSTNNPNCSDFYYDTKEINSFKNKCYVKDNNNNNNSNNKLSDNNLYNILNEDNKKYISINNNHTYNEFNLYLNNELKKSSNSISIYSIKNKNIHNELKNNDNKNTLIRRNNSFLNKYSYRRINDNYYYNVIKFNNNNLISSKKSNIDPNNNINTKKTLCEQLKNNINKESIFNSHSKHFSKSVNNSKLISNNIHYNYSLTNNNLSDLFLSDENINYNSNNFTTFKINNSNNSNKLSKNKEENSYDKNQLMFNLNHLKKHNIQDNNNNISTNYTLVENKYKIHNILKHCKTNNFEILNTCSDQIFFYRLYDYCKLNYLKPDYFILLNKNRAYKKCKYLSIPFNKYGEFIYREIDNVLKEINVISPFKEYINNNLYIVNNFNYNIVSSNISKELE